MEKIKLVLLSIIILGIIAIPFGDKRLIIISIIIEIIFVSLLLLLIMIKNSQMAKIVIYGCIGMAIIVIVGNTLAPPHIQIITTFSKPFNAIILIIGGYILQILLILTSISSLKKYNNNKKLMN